MRTNPPKHPYTASAPLLLKRSDIDNPDAVAIAIAGAGDASLVDPGRTRVVPRSMAGLPETSACVAVRPPLFASAASLGSIGFAVVPT